MTINYQPTMESRLKRTKDIIDMIPKFISFELSFIEDEARIEYFDGFKYANERLVLDEKTVEMLWNTTWWRGLSFTTDLIIYAYKYKMKFWERFENSILTSLIYARVLGSLHDS